jgi:DNA-binding response OmpR family regulator
VAARALTVGGEQGIRSFMCRVLELGGCMPQSAAEERAALEYLRPRAAAQVVVVNGVRPEDGLALLRAAASEAEVGRHGYVLATPSPSKLAPGVHNLVAELGVPLVSKPFLPHVLRAVVQGAARQVISA